MPPDAKAKPARMMAVKKADMRPEVVKQPSGGFFIIDLTQQSCIVQCRPDMDKSGSEKRHPNRDVDNMPDRQ